MYAIFHQLYSLLCLGLAIRGNRLARSAAQVDNVYSETSYGLSNSVNNFHRAGDTLSDPRSDAIVTVTSTLFLSTVSFMI